jgi:hypothetical protein
MNGDTWTCHVCGRERPDELINVRSFDIGMPGGSTVTVNVRYCTDTPDGEVPTSCYEGAEQTNLVRSAREAFGQ